MRSWRAAAWTGRGEGRCERAGAGAWPPSAAAAATAAGEQSRRQRAAPASGHEHFCGCRVERRSPVSCRSPLRPPGGARGSRRRCQVRPAEAPSGCESKVSPPLVLPPLAVSAGGAWRGGTRARAPLNRCLGVAAGAGGVRASGGARRGHFLLPAPLRTAAGSACPPGRYLVELLLPLRRGSFPAALARCLQSTGGGGGGGARVPAGPFSGPAPPRPSAPVGRAGPAAQVWAPSPRAA